MTIRLRCVNLVFTSLLLVSCGNDKGLRNDTKRAALMPTAAEETIIVDYHEGKRSEGGKQAVLFAARTFSNPYFRDMELGVREAFREIAGDYDLIVRAGSREDDVDGQINIINSFLMRHRVTDKYRLAGVILTPVAVGAALIDTIKQLNYAKIPIVIVDQNISRSDLDSGKVEIVTVIGSNNVQGGALAAKIVAKHLVRGGRILLLNGTTGEPNAADRRRGFLHAMEKANPPNVKYEVLERAANGLRDRALCITKGLLESRQHIDGIFAANDQMALGAAEAFNSVPRDVGKLAVIIGYDAIDEARKSVDAGELTATLDPDPRSMGKKAINALRDHWSRKEANPRILVPVKPYPPTGSANHSGAQSR